MKNLIPMARLLISPQYLKWLRMFHRRFSGSPDYKITNIAKSFLNALKNDRMYIHDGHVMYSSFVPPLNSPSYESVVKNVLPIGGDYFKGFTNASLKAPISMYVALTEKCQYNCWHCSRSGRGNTQDKSTVEWKRLLSKIHKKGVAIIGFTGGEPLLRDDLEEILKSIDTEKCMTILFTTGYSLTQERADALKKAGLFAIGISLDSVEPEEHDAKRGFKGAHQIAVEAIKISRKAGLLTMGQLVCTRSLLQDNKLEKTALFMNDLGVQEIRLMEPMPCGELDKNTAAMLTTAELKKIKDFHIRCNNDPKMPKVAAFAYFEDSSQFGCGAGSQHSYIDAQGNLYPCDFLPLSFGNLFEKSFDELWEKMHSITNGPRCVCMSKELGHKLPQFKTDSYPLAPETSKNICSLCKKGKRPDYYILAETGERTEKSKLPKRSKFPIPYRSVFGLFSRSFRAWIEGCHLTRILPRKH